MYPNVVTFYKILLTAPGAVQKFPSQNYKYNLKIVFNLSFSESSFSKL